MAEPLLIGLDVGTTSCKAGLFDAGGNMVALASAPYGVHRLGDGRVEQDAGWYWDSAVRCLRQLLATPGVDPGRLAGMSACGQAPTMILLDAAGDPLRAAILWQDTRAAAEAAALARDPGGEALARWLGISWPVDASMPMARFLWLHRNEPQTLQRTRLVLSPKDLVQLRLTGSVATDLWSARGMVHQGTRQPIAALRELTGLDLGAVPPALASDAIMGRVSAPGAAATGLPEGLPVAAGWTDAMAAMLGSGGLNRAGLAADVSGTSEVVGLTLRERPADAGPLLTAPVVNSGRWQLYGPTQSSGGSLGWAMQTFASPAMETAAALAEAATAPPGAGGVVFLPYLEGERAPLWDPRARGAFAGLGSAQGRAHLLRAVLEGVACSVRHILHTAEALSGTEAAELRVAGGGSRLALWNQIKADVTGRPVRPCVTSENGVLGGAMLAAVGAGVYADVTAAGEAMVQLLDPVPPDGETAETYGRLYERYVALYPRIKDLPAVAGA
jgi:xylulokinase